LHVVTTRFPGEEKFGIVAQIRRAGVSVPTNIAEGAARNSKREFIRFLCIAMGSLSELDTLLLLSMELKYLAQEEFDNLMFHLEVIARLIKGLINKLQRDLKPPDAPTSENRGK